MAWLTTAAALPGSSLAVGLAIWLIAGKRKRHSSLSICPTLLARFGVQRQAGYRGLRALENAGLIEVERARGRCPVVSILGNRVE